MSRFSSFFLSVLFFLQTPCRYLSILCFIISHLKHIFLVLFFLREISKRSQTFSVAIDIGLTAAASTVPAVFKDAKMLAQI